MNIASRFRGFVVGGLFLTAIISTAHAKYSGGTGTAQDPYQIATAADLIALGETPADYDKHFILIEDIDLAPNLPGRKVFDTAVIGLRTLVPWGDGAWADQILMFEGVFDGNGHVISRLNVKGDRIVGLFLWIGSAAQVKDLGLVDVDVTCGGATCGGLVGTNQGLVTRCYTTGVVSGGYAVGGLVGDSDYGRVIDCYSTVRVKGGESVGGLVGYNNAGTVSKCYSTGAVSGSSHVSGLVGSNNGSVMTSFWDTQTSGQTTSAGGAGKTTAEMQRAATFAGWDFQSTWKIREGVDYPRLKWEPSPNAVAMTLEKVSGDNQRAMVGSRLPIPLTVCVRDQYGEAMRDVQAAFTFAAGNGTVEPAAALTNSSGIASTTVTLGPTAGPVKVRATVGSLSVEFDLEGRTMPVATTIEKVSGDNQQAMAGSRLAAPLTVCVKDQYGQGMANVQVAFVFTAGDGVAEPSPAMSNTDGIASVLVTLGPTAGLTHVRATVGSLSVDFSIEAMPLPVVAIIEKVSGDDQRAMAGSKPALPLTVRVKDQYGQGMPNTQVAFTIVSDGGTIEPTSAVTDASGLASAVLTLGSQPGLTQVRASAGSLSAEFNITGLAPGEREGTGRRDDPYLIYTAEQLNAIGTEPNDCEKWFRLMADIDLSGFSYDRAVIAGDANTATGGFEGTAFTGVFDGGGHSISHLTITGKDNLGLFGRLNLGGVISGVILLDVRISGSNGVAALAGESSGDVTQCCVTGSVTGSTNVGGITGLNSGYVTQSCSAVAVRGSMAGGLAGINWGIVAQSYSTGAVKGNFNTGGLVGWNGEVVVQCYSTGAVTGTHNVGGLVGDNLGGTSIDSFWDTQTSGRISGGGGTGATTSRMQTAATFLNAGWDFSGETANGTVDMWWIEEGQGYPRLAWEALSTKADALRDAIFGPRLRVDQTNLPTWTGGWTLLWSKSGGQARMWQTFKPGASSLVAVAIDIMSGNPFFGDDTLTVDIVRNGVILATAARTVQAGFDGLLRFQFEKPLAVMVGQSYELRVSTDGGTFGWKYGLNTYSGGTRYMNSQADSTGDWFFQTYSSGQGDSRPPGR